MANGVGRSFLTAVARQRAPTNNNSTKGFSSLFEGLYRYGREPLNHPCMGPDKCYPPQTRTPEVVGLIEKRLKRLGAVLTYPDPRLPAVQNYSH